MLILNHLMNFLTFNLKNQNLILLTLFHCWNDNREMVKLSKHLSINRIFANMVNIDVAGIPEYLHSFDYKDSFKSRLPLLGVFFDFNCNHSLMFLKKAEEINLFNANYHWLIHDGKGDMVFFEKSFRNFNLSVDADVTYFYPKFSFENQTNFLQFDVYNNGYYLGGKLNITIDREIKCFLEFCEVDQYLSELHLRNKYNNRITQSDITIRIGTIVTRRPYTWPEADLIRFLETINETHVDGIVRYGYRLMLLLKDIIGCQIDWKFTDRWSNNEMTGGAVGDMMIGKVEITSTPFIATNPRLKYISPIIETGVFRLVCIFRTPQNAEIKQEVFIEPFTSAVWYSFGGIILFAAILLWATFYIESRKLRTQSFVPSILSTFLISFGSACIQGASILPGSTGGRMVFFSLSLITFLIYNYYTSAVVSSLLSSPVKSKIKTLMQLAESSLDVGLEPVPFTFAYLNSSKIPQVRKFVERKIEAKKHSKNPVWLLPEEGILKVRDKPGYVYGFEASSGYNLIEKYYEAKEICDLNEILLRTEQNLWTQMHVRSPFQELIRLRQMRLLETGVYIRHRRYWLQTKLNCFTNNFVINVGMEYVAPLFFMLLATYTVVIIVFIIEIFYGKRQQNLIHNKAFAIKEFKNDLKHLK